LSFAAALLNGYTMYSELREFGASVCFYWNMAGLLDRGDWAAIRALQKLELRDHNSTKDAVIVLPFARYQVEDWKFLKDHERFHAPVSVFLAKKFAVEARDIALGETRASALFDQTELTVALEHAHQRGQGQEMTWMPVGQFIWKNRGQWLEEELKRVEGLSDDDAFFKAGLMGGGREPAARTIQKIRLWIKLLPL
jgi:hypothetical protein